MRSKLPASIVELFRQEIPPSLARVERELRDFVDRHSPDKITLYSQSPIDLRRRAYKLCVENESFEGDHIRALSCILVALERTGKRPHDRHNTSLQDLMLLSVVMSAFQSDEGVLYFNRICALVLARDPTADPKADAQIFKSLIQQSKELQSPETALYISEIASAMECARTQHSFGAWVQNTISYIHFKQGNIHKSIVHGKAALHIQERSNSPDSVAIAQSLKNLAMLSIHTHDYHVAIDYFEQALEVIKNSSQDPNGIMRAKIDLKLGMLLMNIHRNDAAREHLSRAVIAFRGRSHNDPEAKQAREYLQNCDIALGMSVDDEQYDTQQFQTSFNMSSFENSSQNKNAKGFSSSVHASSSANLAPSGTSATADRSELDEYQSRRSQYEDDNVYSDAETESDDSTSDDDSELYGGFGASRFGGNAGGFSSGGPAQNNTGPSDGLQSDSNQGGSFGPTGVNNDNQHYQGGALGGSLGPNSGDNQGAGYGPMMSPFGKHGNQAIEWAAEAADMSRQQLEMAYAEAAHALSVESGLYSHLKHSEKYNKSMQYAPRGYGSASVDLGVNEDGSAKYGYSDGLSAAESLEQVTKMLSGAVTAFMAISAKPPPKHLRMDEDEEYDSDGILDGAETEALNVSQSLQAAIQVLSASANVQSINFFKKHGTEDEQKAARFEEEQLESIQRELFDLIADVGDKVQLALRTGGVRTQQLRNILAGPLDEAIDASKEYGVGAEGGGEGPGGGFPFIQPPPTDGIKQPGLVKAEPNPTGRKMKAVAMTASDILDSIKYRLMAVGLMKSLGARRRRGRVAFKLLSLGYPIFTLRERQKRIVALKIFLTGFLCGAIRRREAARRANKCFAIGHLITLIRLRNEAQRRTRVFSLGLMRIVIRHRDIERRRVKLFAVGVFPMWLRTLGNPVGYKPAKKSKKAARNKRDPNAPDFRALHVDKLKKTAGTLWEGAAINHNKSMLAQLFPDLRDMFENKKKVPKAKAATDNKAPKKELIKFISDPDGKRRQNMSISLSKFKKFGFHELAEVLRRMDADRLPGGDNSLEILLSPANLPVASDFENCANFESATNMDIPEEFCWHMSRVPKYEARLKCLQIKTQWKGRLVEVEEMVNTVSRASMQITSSERLRRFLVEYVLPFGNALNAGTKNADAAGIKFRGLLKLADTKTVKNPKLSMLDYLVERVAQIDEQLLDLKDEFPSLENATLVGEDAIRQGIGELQKNRKYLETQVNNVKNDSRGRDEDFLEATEEFAVDAIKDHAQLEERCDRMESEYRLACQYIAEDAKTKKEDLFKLVQSFLKAFSKCVAGYYQRRANEEKERRKAAKKAEEEAKKAARRLKANPVSGKKPQPPPKPPAKDGKIARLASQGLASGPN